MSNKRKRSLDEKLRLSQEKENINGAKIVIEDSKLKHGDDYREKLIKDGERFQDKILEKQSKRQTFENHEGDEEASGRKRFQSIDEEKQALEENQLNLNVGKDIKRKPKKENIDKEVKADSSMKKDGSVFSSRDNKNSSEKKSQSFNKNIVKRKNYDDSSFTRTKSNEEVKTRGKEIVRNRQKKKHSFEKVNKPQKQAGLKTGLITGVEKSQTVVRDYLSSGSEDNVGVEGAEKLADINSKLIHRSQKSFNKRKEKNSYSLKENEIRLRQKKSKLDFRDESEKVKTSDEYRKSSQYKKFQKRRQMKQTIHKKNNTRIRDRIKQSFKELAFSAKNFIARKSKGILIAIVAILLLGTFFISFGGSGLSVMMNTTSSTMMSSYLSDQAILKEINNYFSSKEDELRDELDNVEVNFPGYDEYIINKNGDIGHNVHELLSYITARCGEVKNLSEVTEILDELFEAMYETNYREDIEIRYRTVTETYIDENGEEQTRSYEEPYEYRKLIVTLKIRDMDGIIREVFASYPDNLKHYEALFSAQGNMREVFANADLIASNGGIGGGQEYEASAEVQKRIVDAAYITPSPGAGWCAMWVSQVYQNAGLGYLGGNANDMYRNFTYTSDKSKLQVGMLVAVESSSSGGELGRIYGHVGIYIGDGMVMDNIGVVRVTTLDNWIATFCQYSPVGYGFPPAVQR